MNNPLDSILVEIDSLAPGGDAVGREVLADGSRGRATFVPLAVPGERLRARVVRERARVAWAEIVSIETPSPDRVTPLCPLFGVCGGCQWQHVARRAQVDAKAAIAQRALPSVPVAVATPVDDFGHRDRAKLVVGACDAQGTRAVGFRARRSHDVVDVVACPLFSRALAAALPAVRAWARTLPETTEVSLQAGRREGRLIVAARAGERVLLVDDDGLAREHAREKHDSNVLLDIAEPESPPLWVEPGAFAQASILGNAALVRAAIVAAAPVDARERAVELFAGSGNFTRHLCAAFSHVVASDGDRDARARGRKNAPGARWVAPGDEDALGPFDLALVDPPRTGLDDAALRLAARSRRRIVYVSCDPQTLARDVRRLVDRGWRVTSAVALDLMPQTFHLEMVVVLDRAAAPAGQSSGAQ